VTTCGSGSAHISRNNVLRLAGNLSAVASRVPTQPANASPIDSSMPRINSVRRASPVVRPETCSTKVHNPHASPSQKNRRTRGKSPLPPATAALASLRSYRLCTRPDSLPHSGQQARTARGCAQIRTDPSMCLIRPATNPARCGRSTGTTS
jgi:hypothetical protein